MTSSQQKVVDFLGRKFPSLQWVGEKVAFSGSPWTPFVGLKIRVSCVRSIKSLQGVLINVESLEKIDQVEGALTTNTARSLVSLPQIPPTLAGLLRMPASQEQGRQKDETMRR